MSDTCKYNCSAHPTEINAYGDISGIGVTTAFFATAWIVVLLLIGYYFVAYDPDLDPFRETGKKTLCQYPNTIDYVFIHTVRKIPGLRGLQRTDWRQYSQLESALNKCVIMFSDIQIFTGLAVMISGYIALTCGLQSYHWQLAVYLVWLASLTHLAALSFLRNHFSNHPSQLIWRAIAMFILMILLEVAVGLTGYFSWDKGPNKASDFAACYFGKNMDTESVAFESMLKTLILLVYSFCIRLAKMSKHFEGKLRRSASRLTTRVANQPGDGHNAPPELGQSQITGSGCSLAIIFYTFLSIHLNLITSFLAEVYWLTLSAAWATRRFFKTRLLGPKEEDEWTFGQVLPVLLVVAPLAAILEHFLPRQASNNTTRQSSDQIALLNRGQSETGVRRDEAEDQPETDEPEPQARAGTRDETQEEVQVYIDHRYVHSIEYRGCFLLAVVAYIELGIFFVADLSPGIKDPLIRLGVGFFFLNPMLQLCWINCTRRISLMNWSRLINKTSLGLCFTAFISISVNDFLQVSTKSKADSLDPLFSYVVSALTVISGFTLIEIVGEHKSISTGDANIVVVLVCFFSPVIFVSLCATLGMVAPGNRGPLVFICCLCVCIFVELAWYGFELFMDKVEMAQKCAVYLRCLLMLGILATPVVVKLTTSIAPTTIVLFTSIVASAALWSLVGAISSIVERRRALTPTA